MTLELHREFGRSKLGTVGRKYPHCDLRIIDPDNGTILPANSDGLIEVLAPRIQPDWISTSDIGMIDADGFLFLRGRADGAIMRGGFKILPETIERALLQHPSVAEAAVVAVTDARVAQVPGAMIRLKPDQNPPTIDALTLHLRQLVMATHLPVHWRFVESLPRNPSMKIDRVAIKRAFSAP
jgi:acyl-coenzyme A synthetase/AMP-(fatty) acid ligase